MSDHDDHDLEISRLLKAPRALVWKAWSVKENLEQWWCPKPWKAEFTAFEFHAGGAFDSIMRGPNGEEHAEKGSFLEIVPMQRIVFTDALSGGWRPCAAPFMTAFITLADEAGGTRYVGRVLHKNAEDRQQHLEMGFLDGWGAAIAQLDALTLTLK